jgi:hypothetical protein
MVIVEVGFGIFKNQFEIQITQLEGTGTVGEIVDLFFLGGAAKLPYPRPTHLGLVWLVLRKPKGKDGW